MQRWQPEKALPGCLQGVFNARALLPDTPTPPAAWWGQEEAAHLLLGPRGAGNGAKSRRRGWVICYSWEGEAGEGTGDCCNATVTPLGLWLVTCLPLLGCLSIILQLAVSLQLQPREKCKQTIVETNVQVQSKWEGQALSIELYQKREGSKRGGIDKSVMKSQGVGTLLDKICCPDELNGTSADFHFWEVFEFSYIVRLRVLNHIRSLSSWKMPWKSWKVFLCLVFHFIIF